MFDFRYHALSLVAVFLALAVGLLLGVAIGDQGLVSGAERDVRQGLRSDVRQAQSQAAEVRQELTRHQRFETAAFPALVADRLVGRRVAVLALGGLPGETLGDVQAALPELTGARVAGVGVVRAPLDVDALEGRLADTRLVGATADPSGLGRLGKRVGRGLAANAALLRRLRPALLGSSSGAFDRLGGVVVVRPAVGRSPATEPAFDAFAGGLLDGLGSAGVKVVGAETSQAAPSQIPWYRDRGVSSVDNVDQVAGRSSLVYALAAPVDTVGAYGVRAGADAVFPPGVPQRR